MVQIAVILRCEHLRASKDDGGVQISLPRILRGSPQMRLTPQDDALSYKIDPSLRRDDIERVQPSGTMLGDMIASRCSGRSRLTWIRYSSATPRSFWLSSSAIPIASMRDCSR